MTMTRQDFELIAHAIKEAKIDEEARAAVARSFAMDLSQTNARFNKDRFYTACGVELFA